MLEIIYQDEYYVAINKPNGLLVHRTKIAEEKEFFAVQILREQIGAKVSPVHRLDRKTSGVLVFGLTSEATKLLAKQFTERTTEKEYWAIVRGFAPESGIIDKPLKSEKGNLQLAETHFKTHQNITLPIPMGKLGECTKFADILTTSITPLLAITNTAIIDTIICLSRNLKHPKCFYTLQVYHLNILF
jgi:tRNA pseudouridine65 synthase